MVDGTNPAKLPVTGFVTAPNPTDGDVQRRSSPLPVQVPGVPDVDDAADTAVAASAEVVAATAAVVSTTEAATAAGEEVACYLLVRSLGFEKWREDLQPE